MSKFVFESLYMKNNCTFYKLNIYFKINFRFPWLKEKKNLDFKLNVNLKQDEISTCVLLLSSGSNSISLLLSPWVSNIKGMTQNIFQNFYLYSSVQFSVMQILKSEVKNLEIGGAPTTTNIFWTMVRPLI